MKKEPGFISLTLVLREGALVAGIGCTTGLGLSVVALRLTEGVIAGLPTVDYAVFVGMPALLASVVAAAC